MTPSCAFTLQRQIVLFVMYGVAEKYLVFHCTHYLDFALHWHAWTVSAMGSFEEPNFASLTALETYASRRLSIALLTTCFSRKL